MGQSKLFYFFLKKEEDVNSASKKARSSSGCREPEDIWFQITFSIDPKSYRRLWDYAESVNLGVSSIARESVLDLLKKLESSSHGKKLFSKVDAEDRP